jgi:hypothetical protein
MSPSNLGNALELGPPADGDETVSPTVSPTQQK